MKIDWQTALRTASRRKSMLLLLVKAGSRLFRNPRALIGVGDRFRAVLRLLKSWAMREYTDVSWRSILLLTAAVVYFVNPMDVIPDMLPVIGLLDDIGVITFVLHSLSEDLRRFQEWERQKKYL